MKPGLTLLSVIRSSLVNPSVTAENIAQSAAGPEPDGPGGIKLCVSAAIGLSYNGKLADSCFTSPLMKK